MSTRLCLDAQLDCQNCIIKACLILGLSFGCHASADTIPEEIARDLAQDEFRVREAAQSQLLDWARIKPGPRAQLMLLKARTDQDPEVRQRARDVLYELAMDEYLSEGEGFIGIQMVAVRAEIPEKVEEDLKHPARVREVISVTRVLRGTPAREAGLKVGDLIAFVNGQTLDVDNALPSFQQMIKGMKPGTTARLGIIRDGAWVDIVLKLGRRPPDEQARFLGRPAVDLNELAQRDRDRFFRVWLEKLNNAPPPPR